MKIADIRTKTADELADELETLTGSEYWPFPTYGELMFGVK